MGNKCAVNSTSVIERHSVVGIMKGNPPIIIIIIIIIIFLHGLGHLTCSGIDALPSFPGASTVSSSPRFVVEGLFRESGVVHSFKWLIQFCLYLSLTSCIPEMSSSLLMTSLLILPSLVYPVTLLRKRISAAQEKVFVD